MWPTRRQWKCGHFKTLIFGYTQFSHSFSIHTSDRTHIPGSFTGLKFGHNLRQKAPFSVGSWAAVPESAAPSSKQSHTTSFTACIRTLLSHRRPNSEIHLLPTATNLNCITKPLAVLAVVNQFLKQYKKQFPCYQPACWIQWKSLQIRQFPPTQTDYYSVVFTEYCSSKYKAASSSPVFIPELSPYSYRDKANKL